MSWNVLVAKSAGRQLAKVPGKDRARLIAALESLTVDPFVGDSLKLEGATNRWRRRVGNYRIFFAVNVRSKTVEVSAVTRRTSTTY